MLSEFLDKAKKVVLYVLAPLAFILGYIMYLLGVKNKLEEKLKDAEFRAGDKEKEHDQKDVDKEAASAVDEYESAKREYLSGGNDSKT